MIKIPLFLTAVAALLSLNGSAEESKTNSPSAPLLSEARRGFVTQLTHKRSIGEPVPEPPDQLFRLIKYPSPAGELSAYVSVTPPGVKKYPLIIWLVGGFGSSIGKLSWTPGPSENDQSATSFREGGVLMMYPSLRGGNKNPGFFESFYGEVDDVLAAIDYASKLPGVDAGRIYIGGHSTGGTLALLVAEMAPPIRAVFAFGPVDDIRVYGQEKLAFDILNYREAKLRSPLFWLHGIRCPTFVFEGTGRGNIGSVKALARSSKNPRIHFYAVPDADHFSVLQPVSKLIAKKIAADSADSSNIAFSESELAEVMKRSGEK
jgi:alpha/beta superfamily hydrolase